LKKIAREIKNPYFALVQKGAYCITPVLSDSPKFCLLRRMIVHFFGKQRKIALLLILFADIFIEFSAFFFREAFLLSEKSYFR
jgi:hypothetical protein